MLTNAGYPTSVPEPASGQAVRASFLIALRTAMSAALSDVQMPTPGYTDNVTSGTPIKAIHITELQQQAK